MTNEFDPAAYHDEYREALLAIIEAKAAGEEIAEPAAAPAVGVTDLVAALEASVAAARAARASAAPETLTVKSRPRRAARAPAPVVAVEREVEASPVRRRKSA
jgi:DNA end-binding protein Ku